MPFVFGRRQRPVYLSLRAARLVDRGFRRDEGDMPPAPVGDSCQERSNRIPTAGRTWVSGDPLGEPLAAIAARYKFIIRAAAGSAGPSDDPRGNRLEEMPPERHGGAPAAASTTRQLRTARRPRESGRARALAH